MAQKSGEYVIENLMKKFIRISSNKINYFCKNTKEVSFLKGMKQIEDVEFQNLLQALNLISENSLPSLLKALLDWYGNIHSQNKSSRTQSKIDKIKLPDVCATAELTVLEKYNITETLGIDTLVGTESFERQDLSVDYIFCQSIISILKQLQLHPGNDDYVNIILSMAFRHFFYREDLLSNPNSDLINEIADLYAEVVGVLSQSRFNLVRTKFNNILKSLRVKDQITLNCNQIISLLMGMKFFRVKMYPIEDFVECFNFLTELANFFLEVDDKKIKHALSGLLVEVLLPVAAVVKNEVNIPILKSFVDLLYNPCFEMCSKKKHFSALSPLVTCLLSVGQKHFFLNNWPVFMMTCLGQLKNRDPVIARVALESLFRLLWVYIVRIKGEKHADTQSKLYSIVNSLFPRGSKTVVPRDASTNIFVKIIHFIAQEKLDFAMEVIFDLIGANRSLKVILPERMNIGLCAFLLIALSLQQREGEPPMPQNTGIIPMGSDSHLDPNNSKLSSPYHLSQNTRLMRLSAHAKFNSTNQSSAGTGLNQTANTNLSVSNSFGCSNNMVRRKTSYGFMTLNDRNAASIGINNYISQVRKAFDTMLRLLDQHVIRTMLLTKQENINKESDDVITAERKPKIDLLKTCISAIPRLLPGDMSKSDLVELLSRLSIHVDEELRMMAQQALINIIQEFPNWRYKTIQTFLSFVQKEIPDNSPAQLESSLKIIYYLINAWKTALLAQSKENDQKSKALDKTLLDDIESFCFVMLCQYRSSIRRLSIHILKEVKVLINQIHIDLQNASQQAQHSSTSNSTNQNKAELNLDSSINSETIIEPINTYFAIDTMDDACTDILQKCFHQLPPTEKAYFSALPNIEFMTFAERTNPIWGVTSNNFQPNADDHHTSNSNTPMTGAAAVSSNIASNQSAASSANLLNCSGNSDASTAALRKPINIWTECISVIYSRSHLLTTSPNALIKSWSFLIDRINHLFVILDPTAQVAENRTSSILKSSSSNKKPLTSAEKDCCMLLWRNYIMTACCIALPSNSYVTPTNNHNKLSKTSPEQISNTMDNSQIKSLQKPTSKELLKILVPLIKCEIPDLRDSVIEALGHFNPASLKDLVEEMSAILRESVDKKQENVRRRKRKDCLRLYLVRIFEYLAESGIFDSSEYPNQMPIIVDWLEQLKPYLITSSDGCLSSTGTTANSSMSESSSSILCDTRRHFCCLIQNIIFHAPKNKRKMLFTDSFKQNLFWLIAGWTGNYSKPLLSYNSKLLVDISINGQFSSNKSSTDDDFSNNLCYIALKTQCSLLCCGSVFDNKAITDEGFIMPWLVDFINSGTEELIGLSEDTLFLLLLYNNDTHILLDVLIDYCYHSSSTLSNLVFLAIVRVFNELPDYPCDHVSIITLSIVFTSNVNTQIRDNALQLFQLLYQRFLIEPAKLTTDTTSGNMMASSTMSTSSNASTTIESTTVQLQHHAQMQQHQNKLQTNDTPFTLHFNMKFEQIFQLNQDEISRELADTLPDLTLSIFSEITQRIETANTDMQTTLINCLIPWIYNIEFVDFLYPSAQLSSSGTSTHSHIMRSKQRSSSPVGIIHKSSGLFGSGWGSKQATELVLNNLFYLTVKFNQQLSKDLENVWSCLVKQRPENIPVIIHYLILITSVAPNYLLPYAKHVVVFLSRHKSKTLVENLFYTLQTIDGLNCVIERTTCIPYFRIVNNGNSNSNTSTSATTTNPNNTNNSGNANCTNSTSPSTSMATISQNSPKPNMSSPNLVNNNVAVCGASINAEADTPSISSNQQHRHTISSIDKRVMNNSQQLPIASGRSSTLEPTVNPSRYSAAIQLGNHANMSVSTFTIQNNQNFAQSAPGTLRLEDLDSCESNYPMDEDKYATLRAKDIPKSNSRTNFHGKFQSQVTTATVTKHSPQKSRMDPHPLPLPAYGGYRATLLNLYQIREPCPLWTNNYKSGIVLMLFMDIIPLKSTRNYWERDLELLLHCIVLGLDHKEHLVFEQCKLLLMKILQCLCPDQEEWKILSMLMTGSMLIPDKSTLNSNKGITQLQKSESHTNWQNLLNRLQSKSDIGLLNSDLIESTSNAPVVMRDQSMTTSRQLQTTSQSNYLQRTMSSYSVTSTDTLIPGKLNGGENACLLRAKGKSHDRNINKQSLQGSSSVGGIGVTGAGSGNHGNTGTDPDKAGLTNHTDYVMKLTEMICLSRNKPLWNYEYVTPAKYISEGVTLTTNYNQAMSARLSMSNFQPNISFSSYANKLGELSAQAAASANTDSGNAASVCDNANTALNSMSEQCFINETSCARSDQCEELILVSSTATLNSLVGCIIYLIDSDNTLALKWAQLALNTGVNCTHRHYASRSLQIFRALKVPFDGIKLSSIFSRLLDTIGDPNDDVQCYVVELLLTIECAIHDIIPNAQSIDVPIRHRTKSKSSAINKYAKYKPEAVVTKQESSDIEDNDPSDFLQHKIQQVPEHKKLNTSFYLNQSGGDEADDIIDDNNDDEEQDDENCDELYRSTPNLKNIYSSPKLGSSPRQRNSTFCDSNFKTNSTAFKRSSAIIENVSSYKKNISISPIVGKLNFNKKSHLKDCEVPLSSYLSRDERSDLIVELFWLAHILLESELDHEYFAGIRCLQKMIGFCYYRQKRKSNNHQINFNDLKLKLEQMVPRLNWSNQEFPGSIHLVIKGCLNRSLGPTTSNLLTELIPCCNNRLVDNSCRNGFAYAVLTLLTTVFDEDSFVSRRAANNIARIADDNIYGSGGGSNGNKLNNLVAVMRLYAGGSFTKDRSQWTRCVVKYVLDGYSDCAADLLGFVARLLEDGPNNTRLSVLHALNHLVQCVPLQDANVIFQLNSIIDLLTRLFLNHPTYWREACPILKLIVSRSSSLALPTTTCLANVSMLHSLPMVPLPEAEAPKLELPGRILDYKFDVTLLHNSTTSNVNVNQELSTTASQAAGDSQNNTEDFSSNRRSTYTKTRELLLQLINAFGTYGSRLGFPKSPSVIFSQSTETLEHQISLHSSSETASTNDISLAGDFRLEETSSIEQAQVIRDLDEYLDSQLKMNFLDLPDNKWEDDKKPSWGVRSQSITQYQEMAIEIGATPSSAPYKQQPQDMISALSDNVFDTGANSPPATHANMTIATSPASISSPGVNTAPRTTVVLGLHQNLSPSKTLPCRAPKSPMSKAVGGPDTTIVSPQMTRTNEAILNMFPLATTTASTTNAIVRPQSLMFIGSSSNTGTQFSSTIDTLNKMNKMAHQRNPSSDDYEEDAGADDEFTNEDNDQIRKGSDINQLIGSLHNKSSHLAGSSSSDGDLEDLDDEDDDEDVDDDIEDEEDLLCRRELHNLDTNNKSNCLRRRLHTSSFERSSSTNYEKEIELIWCDTLCKVLANNYGYYTINDSLSSPSLIAQQQQQQLAMTNSPTLSSLNTTINYSISNLWSKFPMLFEDCCSKCRTCINEANYYVSVVKDLQGIAANFVNIIKQICDRLKSPLFYLGENHLINPSKLIENHKLTLMQMQETYDKFCNHLDYSFEILDMLKRSTRISHNQEDVKPDEKRINLCRQLHKMLTQLLLLYQCHCRFLSELRNHLLSASRSSDVDELALLQAPVDDRSMLLQDISTQLELQMRRYGSSTSGSSSSLCASSCLSQIRSLTDLQLVEAEIFKALRDRNITRAVEIWSINRVSIMMFNKCLETDHPWYYLMQTFCQWYSRDQPSILLLINPSTEYGLSSPPPSPQFATAVSGASTGAISSTNPIYQVNKLANQLLAISSELTVVEHNLDRNLAAAANASNRMHNQSVSAMTSPHKRQNRLMPISYHHHDSEIISLDLATSSTPNETYKRNNSNNNANSDSSVV